MRLNNKGLTLVEILVVVTIFSIIVTSLFMVFKGSLDAWRRSEQLLSMYQDARLVLDLMAKEIPSAYLFQDSADQTQWTRFLGIDEAGTRLMPNSAKDELFFVAPVALKTGEATRSDLCEIGYWLDSTNNKLMRHFKYFKTAPIKIDFSTKTSETTESMVASNVTDLQFTYYYRNSAGTAPTTTTGSWDSSANGLTGALENYDKNGNAKNPDGLPDAVGISIIVKTRDGTQSRTFTTFVQIPGAK